jgi:hypothetical protein
MADTSILNLTNTSRAQFITRMQYKYKVTKRDTLTSSTEPKNEIKQQWENSNNNDNNNDNKDNKEKNLRDDSEEGNKLVGNKLVLKENVILATNIDEDDYGWLILTTKNNVNNDTSINNESDSQLRTDSPQESATTSIITHTQQESTTSTATTLTTTTSTTTTSTTTTSTTTPTNATPTNATTIAATSTVSSTPITVSSTPIVSSAPISASDDDDLAWKGFLLDCQCFLKELLENDEFDSEDTIEKIKKYVL